LEVVKIQVLPGPFLTIFSIFPAYPADAMPISPTLALAVTSSRLLVVWHLLPRRQGLTFTSARAAELIKGLAKELGAEPDVRARAHFPSLTRRALMVVGIAGGRFNA
jgi:hypothetical protein